MSSQKALSPPFVWGVATSSYQIEGAIDADGRAPSIWDTFCDQEGRIEDGTSGQNACDHYHRWREDLEHMKWMGVDAYRFSIAWPRVFPQGAGALNEAGLDFYDRLVDGLIEAGITPYATLYHWDLPQALEDRGGWRSRETVHAFVDYARAVAGRLGDRVKHWVTQNEPWCAAMLGHMTGEHAPGRSDGAEALTAAHHLMLSHGLSIPAIRAECAQAQIGLAHMYLHCEPASSSPQDALACHELDGTFNRWYLDPLYGRGYPAAVLEQYASKGFVDATSPTFLKDGDLEAIATPTDFLGMNYYTRGVARSEVPPAQNLPREVIEAPPEARTDMGWEVYPKGLSSALLRLQKDYSPPKLYVTENGAAYGTAPDANGRVQDEARTAYLRAHLDQVAHARSAGAAVEGYFAWSLLDNFEWAYGYAKRFGLIHVDFQTQRRTRKDSAHWYRSAIMNSKREKQACGV